MFCKWLTCALPTIILDDLGGQLDFCQAMNVLFEILKGHEEPYSGSFE
jgi:hypothetical protein